MGVIGCGIGIRESESEENGEEVPFVKGGKIGHDSRTQHDTI